MTDRLVHAENDQMQVVRYDRAGKWYLEPTGDGKRQCVSVKDAAKYADWVVNHANGVVHFGLSGGARFDALIWPDGGGYA